MKNDEDESRAFHEALGKKLKTYRLQAKQSKKALAKILRVSDNQIHKYELGTNRISVARIVTICELYGVSTEEFLNSEINRNEDTDSRNEVCKRRRNAVAMYAYRRLTKEDKQFIDKLIDVLACIENKNR